MTEGRSFAAAAIVGQRERQEDDWGVHVEPPTVEGGASLLAVLADGMGGAPAGDCASRTVVRAFFENYTQHAGPAPTRLELAAWGANDAVADAVLEDETLNGMGATLVAGLFFPDRCVWLSIGDSFIYLCRNAHLQRLNPLHIYATELDARAARGEISQETARNHPERHQLTSVVMGWPMEQVAAGELALEAGDVVLLASDGLATLADEEVVGICQERGMGSGKSAQCVADALLKRIEDHEAPQQDNVTVIVVLADGSANRVAPTIPAASESKQGEEH